MLETIILTADELLTRLLSNIGTWFGDHGLPILIIIIIAGILKKFGARFLAKVFEATAHTNLYLTKSDRRKRLKTLENLSGDILAIAVYIVAALMIVSELGVNTAPLVASAGVIGVIVGIGAQSLVRDIASGFYIIVNNQYRIGDEVDLRVGGAMATVSGIVEDIGLRSTLLRDLSGELHHIPNGNIMIASNKTIGFSRINIDLTFNPDADLEKVKLIINRAGNDFAQDPKFEKQIKKAPQLSYIQGFSSDGVTVKVLGTISSTELRELQSEFYGRLIKALNKASIYLAGVEPPKKKKSS